MSVGRATVSEIEPLISEKKGNIAAIARRLGVSRGTIYNRCSESPTLAQALADARESMIDDVESVLYKIAVSGTEIAATIFFLKTQGRKRGYTERQELILDFEKLSQLTDDQLRAIAEGKSGGITGTT